MHPESYRYAIKILATVLREEGQDVTTEGDEAAVLSEAAPWRPARQREGVCKDVQGLDILLYANYILARTDPSHPLPPAPGPPPPGCCGHAPPERTVNGGTEDGPLAGVGGGPPPP